MPDAFGRALIGRFRDAGAGGGGGEPDAVEGAHRVVAGVQEAALCGRRETGLLFGGHAPEDHLVRGVVPCSQDADGLDGEGVVSGVEEGQSRVGDDAVDGGAERLDPVGVSRRR